MPDESIYLERDYDLILKEYNKTKLMNIPSPAIKDMISYVKVLLLSWEGLFVFFNLPSLSISTASLGGRDRGVLIKINTERKGVRIPTFFFNPRDLWEEEKGPSEVVRCMSQSALSNKLFSSLALLL